MMKYIYGPIQSRRIGLSLGVSPIALKTCNFDCVYCQLGETVHKANARAVYVDAGEILAEVRQWLHDNPDKKLQYITLCGFGEPTLHAQIGEIIAALKKLSPTPIAVITNGSLLSDPAVRQSLRDADLVVPSLDAVEQDIFDTIDRPVAGININDIIAGLIAFRKEYRGALWLEVMLVAGINDGLEHVKKLRDVISRIAPDKIQLNTPVRKTAVAGIRAPDAARLAEIRKILGKKCEIV